MRHKTILEEGMHRGFKRGLNAVTVGEAQQLRSELKEIIGGQTASKLTYYINGTTIIRQEMAQRIEKAFAQYGVAPEQVWDI